MTSNEISERTKNNSKANALSNVSAIKKPSIPAVWATTNRNERTLINLFSVCNQQSRTDYKRFYYITTDIDSSSWMEQSATGEYSG
jgi:hypothetical protein